MMLSLCMIVKNEEDNLPRCLDSVKDIVDEMVIVDTGSDDSTVSVARSYGARVYHFPWNGSFSDARNHSLSHAAGDWILFMDADDELERSDQMAVVELVKKDEADAYFFKTVSYIGDAPGLDSMNNLNIRLMKNGRGYRFSKAIHEQIYSNIKSINPDAIILNEDITVYHYGYLNSNISNKDKRKRNISILKKELEENPDYAFGLFNLGNEYVALGDNRKALECYEKSYSRFDPCQGFSSKLLLKMAGCYINMGRYEDALGIVEKGLSHYPGFTELEHLRATVFYIQKKYSLAIRHLERCLEMGDSSLDLSMIEGSGSYRAYHLLGDTFHCMKDFEMAEKYYIMALKCCPSFTTSLVKLIGNYSAMNAGYGKVKEKLGRLKDTGIPKFNSIVYETLINERYYELAVDYINQEIMRQGRLPCHLYNKALCKLYLKEYKKAQCIMEGLEGEKDFEEKAACIRSLCLVLDNDSSKALSILEEKQKKNRMAKVYSAFIKIIDTGEKVFLSDDEKESSVYTCIIFDLLKILVSINEFKIFEKALELLNSVNDKTVLLKLAKLYYSYNSLGLAYQELIRSIKEFGLIDVEGAEILYQLKLKGL